MEKKRTMLILVLVVAYLAVWVFAAGSKTLEKTDQVRLRVGVYDSRAIPMAYTYSQYNDQFMQKTSEEKKEAEAKSDTQKAEQLEAQMQRYALKRHKQVFSTTSVTDLLALVKDKLPKVAEQTGVNMIVSKWQIDYLASDAEVVDITLEMAKMFEPEKGTLERIKELMKKEPLPEEQVERLEKEHPH